MLCRTHEAFSAPYAFGITNFITPDHDESNPQERLPDTEHRRRKRTDRLRRTSRLLENADAERYGNQPHHPVTAGRKRHFGRIGAMPYRGIQRGLRGSPCRHGRTAQAVGNAWRRQPFTLIIILRQTYP